MAYSALSQDPASIFLWLSCLWLDAMRFNPLSSYPGPWLWAASRIPYVVSLLRGTLISDMLRLHQKYGPIVRLAPNELSFASEAAWRDIYMHRKGHAEAKKDTTGYMAPEGMPPNIVTTPDIQIRARMRRLLSTSFNAQSLLEQALMLQKYANIVIERLYAICEANPSRTENTVVNMLDWTNFYTMDVIGDLAMGESFHCLEQSSYHLWVKTLYMFLKGMIIAAAVRFFPGGWFMLQAVIPKSLREQQKQHTEFTNTKIRQRVELKTDRPDFLSPFLREMEMSPDKMSLGEIQSTFGVILIAGSETTATILVGCLYRLASNLTVQTKLWSELNRKFATDEMITVESTNSLEYPDAVLNETLRLCYAIPGGLPRVVPENGDTYAGHFVPGGTSISIRPHVILHSEGYFKDAWTFAPERWLPIEQRPERYAHDNLATSQPFSIGPTGCIGKPLAWAEMRIFIAKMLWHFNLSMTEERPFKWENLRMMMVVEKRPLWLALEKREH
ncbi:putative RNA polymerase II mediator complex component Srb8 [Bimuria novae-zelandiae CBS 107.79]|uniref:Putative RNA polymerase II mediator complex component Srb8 n=1 Tax=Bimuria novae-zelandiae CBS 107.79 TaxID=1447943 RepID=A0A6A5V9J6_9PLEO|nr:putative RNA polymerase II mediator complex component Srb8 [Bimuria novae-zelandiae CBS 107.79]